MPRKDGVLATVTTVPGPRRPRPLTTRRCGSGTPMTLRICRTRSCLFTDRKSTRLNSSHSQISYAVFCLKKKKHLELAHHSQSSDDTSPRSLINDPHISPHYASLLRRSRHLQLALTTSAIPCSSQRRTPR